MRPARVFIHPKALVDTTAIGAGTRIWAFAHVCEKAVVGAHCNIGEGCYVEGGSRIGDHVTVKNGAMIWEGVEIADGAFIGPGVVFTNDLRPRSRRAPDAARRYASKQWLRKTSVGRGASIGAHATIGSGIVIGVFAMIGAGAMVTRDVPAFAVVTGNPARVRGHACACGGPLRFRGASGRCGDCGRSYRRARGTVVPAGAPARA
jgi:acetyltransferase-like isoleucine patch superfamily enzyme